MSPNDSVPTSPKVLPPRLRNSVRLPPHVFQPIASLSLLPPSVGTDFANAHRHSFPLCRRLLPLNDGVLRKGTRGVGIVEPVHHGAGPDEQCEEGEPDESSEQEKHCARRRRPRVIEMGSGIEGLIPGSMHRYVVPRRSQKVLSVVSPISGHYRRVQVRTPRPTAGWPRGSDRGSPRARFSKTPPELSPARHAPAEPASPESSANLRSRDLQ